MPQSPSKVLQAMVSEEMDKGIARPRSPGPGLS